MGNIRGDIIRSFVHESSDKDAEYVPSRESKQALEGSDFNCTIKNEDWLFIRPVRVSYKKDQKEYLTLQDPWITVFRRAIWEASKLPYFSTFKHCIVTKNNELDYLRIESTYREVHCGALLGGTCAKKPKPSSDVIVRVSTYQTTHSPFRKGSDQRLSQ
ncbi:hypothetical protein QAD02_011080 [Eretmocerus hayati]|uniref:Uncharacterized protein n=1 Tax=Eretmocerus hayati TaxID=131215 RepID=A0ACC2NVJ9_9HYME|nr:hypothetical protein QAD02_011080 [Eretmocerus hayati]